MSGYVGPDRRKVERGGKPPCPHCGSDLSKVIDSGMPSTDTTSYQRRRQCLDCHKRWTTYELNGPAEKSATHNIWR